MFHHKTKYNVQYNIPRVMVSFPGRQNRLMEGELRITPGLTEVVEFLFGNQDGIPLNLVPFKVKIVFWTRNDLDRNKLSLGRSEIVLSKEIQVDDPYAGVVTMILEDSETLTLGHEGAGSLRWSLFMINEEGQVFPAQVSRTGGRFGTVLIDLDSGIPVSELIR